MAKTSVIDGRLEFGILFITTAKCSSGGTIVALLCLLLVLT